MSEAVPVQQQPSEPDRRQFLRTAAFGFVGATAPLPLWASDVAEQRTAWARVPTEEAWRHFQQQLEAVLDDLAVDEYLIISLRRRPDRYVQFACEGRFGILAETVSNRHPDADDRLTPEAHERLVALGWQLPDEHVDGSPNYNVHTGWPVPTGALADLTVRTLRGSTALSIRPTMSG